jgi:hypothetical protein
MALETSAANLQNGHCHAGDNGLLIDIFADFDGMNVRHLFCLFPVVSVPDWFLVLMFLLDTNVVQAIGTRDVDA